MDRKQIEKLFTLFSGENDIEKWSDLIDDAVFHTELLLRDEADKTDARLPFYAAAYANAAYKNIWANKIRNAQTFAGNIDMTADCSAQVERAEHMAKKYYANCSEFFDDSAFYFLQTGGNL